MKVSAAIEPVESLIISAYHIRGTDDYAILYNNGQLPLRLSDYAVTDSKEDWSKGRLPEVELEPDQKYVAELFQYSTDSRLNLLDKKSIINFIRERTICGMSKSPVF